MQQQDTKPKVSPNQGNPDAVLDGLRPDLPEKLQGKTAEEIGEMYTNLETRLGKQSDELGQLRRLAELKAAAAAPARDKPEPEWDPNDPEPYIDHLVSKKLAPAAEVIAQTKQQSFDAALDNKYPGWREVVKDEDFGNWVAASRVRVKLFNAADSSYDTDAAAELIDTYRQLHNIGENAAKAAEAAVKREDGLRKASVERGRGGSGLGTGKRVRSSDIRAMRQHRPDEYQRRAAEIRQMYADGRVIRD